MYPWVILDSLQCLGEDGRRTGGGEELTPHRPEQEPGQHKPTEDNQKVCHVLPSLHNWRWQAWGRGEREAIQSWTNMIFRDGQSLGGGYSTYMLVLKKHEVNYHVHWPFAPTVTCFGSSFFATNCISTEPCSWPFEPSFSTGFFAASVPPLCRCMQLQGTNKSLELHCHDKLLQYEDVLWLNSPGTLGGEWFSTAVQLKLWHTTLLTPSSETPAAYFNPSPWKPLICRERTKRRELLNRDRKSVV